MKLNTLKSIMINHNQALYLRTVKEINDIHRSNFVTFINTAGYDSISFEIERKQKALEDLYCRMSMGERQQIKCIKSRNNL